MEKAFQMCSGQGQKAAANVHPAHSHRPQEPLEKVMKYLWSSWLHAVVVVVAVVGWGGEWCWQDIRDRWGVASAPEFTFWQALLGICGITNFKRLNCKIPSHAGPTGAAGNQYWWWSSNQKATLVLHIQYGLIAFRNQKLPVLLIPLSTQTEAQIHNLQVDFKMFILNVKYEINFNLNKSKLINFASLQVQN